MGFLGSSLGDFGAPVGNREIKLGDDGRWVLGTIWGKAGRRRGSFSNGQTSSYKYVYVFNSIVLGRVIHNWCIMVTIYLRAWMWYSVRVWELKGKPFQCMYMFLDI